MTERIAVSAQLLIRVWVEHHDSVLRGRVIRVGRYDVEAKSARGISDLLETVRVSMVAIEAELADSVERTRDEAATEQ